MNTPAGQSRGGVSSFPGLPMQEWKSALKKAEVKARAEMNAQFTRLNRSLDNVFKRVDTQMKKLDDQVGWAHEKVGAVHLETKKALRKIGSLEEGWQDRTSGSAGDRDLGLRVDTDTEPSPEPFSWDGMSAVDQEKMTKQVLEHLDYDRLVGIIVDRSGLSNLKNEAAQTALRLWKS